MNITFASEIKDGFFIKTACFGEENYYFKFPKKYRDEITGLCDPFIVLLIFRMMRQGGDIRVKGTVSKSLLDSMELFAAYWQVLVPEIYKEIQIIADEELNDIPAELPNKAIAAFSGGLDASFMFYRHKKNLAGRNNRNIERCVFIWGMDAELERSERGKEKSFSACEKMCKDLGVELIPVETNCRYYPMYSKMEHMAVVASSLRFWKAYPYQMIASSYPVSSFAFPWSSNPVTDRLFSSNNYKTVVDDIDFTRMEKAAFIKSWEAGITNLRVCFSGCEEYVNCGMCEKCLRTWLNFKASGIDRMPNMHKQPDIELFKRMDFELFDKNEKFYKDILQYVHKHKIKDKIFEELEKEFFRKIKQRKMRKITYLRCLLFSKLSFGKRKEHYLKKMYRYKSDAEKIAVTPYYQKKG